MKTISIRIFNAAIILVMVAFAFFTGVQLASAQAAHTWTGADVDLEGWAWSSNIGWISMSCATGSHLGTSVCGSGPGQSNYGVSIDNTNGRISGYAWSSNIGWIQFSGNGGGCPAGSNCNARVVDDGGIEMRGWARALSHGGGWDGWISLSCENMSECGTSSYQPEFGNGVMTGLSYAWGSFVVGWIDLSGIAFTPPCDSAAGTSCRIDGTGYESTDSWCRTTTTSCPSGQTCSTYPPGCTNTTPTVTTFTPDSTVVRVGDTVTVDIDVTGVVGSCIVITIEGNSAPLLPDAGGNVVTTWTSPALTGQTTFTLECDGIEVGDFAVQVIPISTEI